jgi:hypothetical protein
MTSAIRHLKTAVSSSRRLAALPAIGLLGLACAGCHGPSAELTGRASDEWTRSYTLDEGGELQITNTNGSVTLEAVDGNAVDVRVERIAKAANDAAAAEIVTRIVIQEEVTPARVTLRSAPLSGIVIGVSTETRYHVRAPRTSVLRIRAVNGALAAKGFGGRAILTSVNGDLSADEMTGGIEARSTNGAARLGLTAFGSELVDVRVTNGTLELTLPESADANLTASVTNGKIDIDELKLDPLGDQTPRRRRARLNAGGTPIDLNVTNGNLVVKPR